MVEKIRSAEGIFASNREEINSHPPEPFSLERPSEAMIAISG